MPRFLLWPLGFGRDPLVAPLWDDLLLLLEEELEEGGRRWEGAAGGTCFLAAWGREEVVGRDLFLAGSDLSSRILSWAASCRFLFAPAVASAAMRKLAEEGGVPKVGNLISLNSLNGSGKGGGVSAP